MGLIFEECNYSYIFKPSITASLILSTEDRAVMTLEPFPEYSVQAPKGTVTQSNG